ncbi:Metalloprotease LoiP precursor [Hartmannibacter diazotrophicus]|uniref:Metalloprotease LoiP n=1 Tax=Hartmannibacter diazotrophicus TaxID=1482074 RepID=A0A2C9DCZ1_9HYPH|nr:M48 family metallopeptidase [Hartmannibacter diazotrophicus]SON58194.1 Metalloprotease LoiP precursor [Hartmannibacter diazotrophicus]
MASDAAEGERPEGDDIARGDWYPANANRSVPSVLRRDDDCLRILASADDRLLAVALLDRIAISDRVGTIARHLRFPDESLFETRDNDAIDRILAVTRPNQGLVHAFEAFRPRLLFVAAAALLLIGAVYRLALPLLVEAAIVVTPPAVPDIMSATTIASLDRTVLAPSRLPEDRRTEITRAFSALAAHSDGEVQRFSLLYRDGGVIGANAFALPDGSIILTDQLVALANGDDEMTLGVLAHEIGHVELKHSLRQLYRAAGTYGMIMLMAGDVGSGVEDLLFQGGGLMALSYSRQAEAEADHRSVELMAAAGKDPRAIGRFFALIASRYGDKAGTSLLGTHPGTADRQRDIAEYAASIASRTSP